MAPFFRVRPNLSNIGEAVNVEEVQSPGRPKRGKKHTDHYCNDKQNERTAKLRAEAPRSRKKKKKKKPTAAQSTDRGSSTRKRKAPPPPESGDSVGSSSKRSAVSSSAKRKTPPRALFR